MIKHQNYAYSVKALIYNTHMPRRNVSRFVNCQSTLMNSQRDAKIAQKAMFIQKKISNAANAQMELR